MVSSNGRVGQEAVASVLSDEYDLGSIVSASLAGTHNVNWRTRCVAKSSASWGGRLCTTGRLQGSSMTGTPARRLGARRCGSCIMTSTT